MSTADMTTTGIAASSGSESCAWRNSQPFITVVDGYLRGHEATIREVALTKGGNKHPIPSAVRDPHASRLASSSQREADAPSEQAWGPRAQRQPQLCKPLEQARYA